MSAIGFAVFDTVVGPCGVAWSARGLCGAQLPMASLDAARRRLKERFPLAEEIPPPPAVRAAIGAIVALFDGEKADLSAAPLDLSAVTAFQRKVYEIALTIPPGETLTYGEIAERIGDKGEARAVGEALGRNPLPIDRKSTRLNSSHIPLSRMPSSA